MTIIYDNLVWIVTSFGNFLSASQKKIYLVSLRIKPWLIHPSRNNSFDWFYLRSGSDHLLMWDANVGFIFAWCDAKNWHSLGAISYSSFNNVSLQVFFLLHCWDECCCHQNLSVAYLNRMYPIYSIISSNFIS